MNERRALAQAFAAMEEMNARSSRRPVFPPMMEDLLPTIARIVLTLVGFLTFTAICRILELIGVL